MSESRLRSFRSHEASMVYQDPAQAMNPTIRVGKQLIESFTLLGQSQSQAEASALEALRKEDAVPSEQEEPVRVTRVV